MRFSPFRQKGFYINNNRILYNYQMYSASPLISNVNAFILEADATGNVSEAFLFDDQLCKVQKAYHILEGAD